MEFVNALWDEKNLGLKSCEFVINREDSKLSKNEIIRFVEEHLQEDFKYIVLKTSFINEKILSIVDYFGFKYIENQFVYNLNKSEYYNSIYHLNYIDKSYTCIPVDAGIYLSSIFSEINKGIYKTDRIALDKKFGVQISNSRYSNWAKDILDNGKGVLWLIYKDDIPIGYEIGYKNRKLFEMILSGVFIEFQNKGYGKKWQNSFLNKVFNGFDSVSTVVSSNNIPIIKIRQSAGFTISKIMTVFIKHL